MKTKLKDYLIDYTSKSLNSTTIKALNEKEAIKKFNKFQVGWHKDYLYEIYQIKDITNLI